MQQQQAEPHWVDQALIVRPGDTLILRVTRRLAADQAEHIKAAVQQRIPGIDVVIIECDQLSVYRP